jgi:hypothetical protein
VDTLAQGHSSPVLTITVKTDTIIVSLKMHADKNAMPLARESGDMNRRLILCRWCLFESRLLALPGSSWVLLGPPGSSWVLLVLLGPPDFLHANENASECLV